MSEVLKTSIQFAVTGRIYISVWQRHSVFGAIRVRTVTTCDVIESKLYRHKKKRQVDQALYE